MRKIVTILNFLLLIVISTSVSARSQELNESSNFKRKEVFLNISVVTKENKFVSQLKESDFRIREGKEIKKITSIVDSGPASVVFVVDTSGSMDRVDSGAMSRAAGRFIRNSDSRNEYATIRLGSSVEMLQDFTTDYDLVKSAFSKIHDTPRKSKSSKVFDSVAFAFEQLKSAKNEKKILIVLSDLLESGSNTKFNQLKDLAKRSNAVVYCIVPELRGDSAMNLQSETLGQDMARLTGGVVHFYQTRDDLDFAIDMAVLSIQQMYIIGFEPSNASEEWRDLDVRVLTSKEMSKSVIVRSRAGYYYKSQ